MSTHRQHAKTVYVGAKKSNLKKEKKHFSLEMQNLLNPRWKKMLSARSSVTRLGKVSPLGKSFPDMCIKIRNLEILSTPSFAKSSIFLNSFIPK
jgi:hypothetical protein